MLLAGLLACRFGQTSGNPEILSRTLYTETSWRRRGEGAAVTPTLSLVPGRQQDVPSLHGRLFMHHGRVARWLWENHENMCTTCSVDKASPPGTHVSPSPISNKACSRPQENVGWAPGSDSLRESQTLSSEKRDWSQEKFIRSFIIHSVVHSFTDSLIHSLTHSFVHLSSSAFLLVIVLDAALCLGNSA